MKSKICYDMIRTSVPGVAMESSQEGSVGGPCGGGLTAAPGGGLDLANLEKLSTKALVAELGRTGGLVPS